MRSFIHEGLPSRVVFGCGSLKDVGNEVSRLGLNKVLLIADGSATDARDQIVDILGRKLGASFEDVRQHVPEKLVAQARDVCRATEADGLVTLGGGSATGLAKAIAVDNGLPILAIPTTYAGSEMTPIYGITGTTKRTGRDLRALPKTVIYDPTLTIGLPPGITGPSGLNAIAHCVEALYAEDASPVTSIVAEEGIRALGRSLVQAVREPENLEARSDALYGAHLAGVSLAVAGIALHHRLCHVLGGMFGFVHGQLNAVLLPHVVAFNESSVPDELSKVARALETDLASEGLWQLARSLEAPRSLSELGMEESALEGVANLAYAEAGRGNPKPVDVQSLRCLLGDAWKGSTPRSW